MRLGSLCSGAGGLDMAVDQVFGVSPAWHCEIDPAASKVLAHRYPQVPNHRDLIQTDWAAVEPIDILAAGWPCQPWSAAGKKLGAEDERAIWPEIARAVRILRPRIICLENVPTVVRVGELQRVADSLSLLGYDLRWTCLRASDVGAAHRRERLFIVAHANESRPQGTQPTPGRDVSSGGIDADTASNRRHEGRTESAGLVGGSDASFRGSPDVALFPTPKASDGGWATPRTSGRPPEKATHLGTIVSLLPTPSASDGIGGGPNNPNNRIAQGHHVQLLDMGMASAETWGKYAAAISRWEQVAGPAPAPTEPNSKGKPRLNPAFSEWMMGWPPGWVTEVPGISRNDQLRIIGNGVVPQCASAALRYLLSVEAAA